MISIAAGVGVAEVAVVRIAGAFRAPAAHRWAAIAPQGKRRPAAAAGVASVNRGFR
ncbi:hypothetical protein [[Mycobacterium] wendilense]|uniref:Uncharacterized protein n=1 Tax=[Mycobacterium] wendilense TaxID=3064284 RepID=A0ABM9MGL7_9MYCO|nr:hypothetical protein [Mycolicibacterium sp. MU0050]CAJ1584683.1 hypothetical protein MU0050_003324 [Mycolicibacterium sp. MU0050]